MGRRNPNSPSWGCGELELGEVRAEFGKRREERKKGETSYVTNTKLVLCCVVLRFEVLEKKEEMKELK